MPTGTIKYILLFIFLNNSVSADLDLRITGDDPIVKGGTIHFTATVYEDDVIVNRNNLKFFWEDNAIPQHKKESEIKNATDTWVVTYDADDYANGKYIVNVIVKTCLLNIVCYEETSARKYFIITETLNGNMVLVQGNQTVDKNFVSNTSTVSHEIQLKKTDMDYVKNAPTVLTYWFIDCTYYGITTDFKFPFNYTESDTEHFIEALIMADFTPLPPTTTVPPSTTTTTIKPTTVKPNSTTTAKVSVTTSSTNSSAVSKGLKKRSTNINVTSNVTFPYVCNGTQIAADSKKSYGYFFKRIQVKAPISRVNVTGNNWIQHGELLSLKVQCRGSKDIDYCVQYKAGTYNVTGNETCYKYDYLDSCDFVIRRYLSGTKYTVLIIVRNDVSKVVQPVTVTFYEVTTQAQLSVIVVPVAFSLVAVVLIVFGIAYYFQNRSRFVIEVADFNFGQQYSDLEYKTFRERLRDSIVNAFTRGPTPSSSEVPVWPPGRKYGSMT